MKLNLKAVDLGQQVAAVAAVLLFVFLFIGWYSVGGAVGALAEGLGVHVSIKGWDAHTLLRWLMLLTIVGALGLAFLSATGRTVKGLPVAPSAILTALAGLTTILLAFRMFVDQPGPDSLIDLKFGAFLGLFALIGVTVGGWLSMRASGTSLTATADQVRQTFTHPPAPPTQP